MKKLNRICIYPKDIVLVTGQCERSARTLLDKIKKEYSKRDDQFVSVEEFCLYTGLKMEHVQPFLID